MIHKITDHYHFWLDRYKQQKNCAHRKVAISLMKQLDLVESIEALQGMLHAFPRPHTDPSFFADPFVKQFDRLVTIVDQLASVNITAICSKLDTITTNENTRNVISLIKEILTRKQGLLHANISHLLKSLENLDELQNIMIHLAAQPQCARPTQPRIGSFDALSPRNEPHLSCLNLLRNNSGTFNAFNRSCIEANNLLQTLLSIYEDINTLPDAPIHTSSSCCSIQ